MEDGRWKKEEGCQCPLTHACVTVKDKVGREVTVAAAASCCVGLRKQWVADKHLM